MNNYNPFGFQQPTAVLDSDVTKVMRRVYLKMFLALLVTTATSMLVLAEGSFLMYMLTHSWVYWTLLIAELVMVFSISGAINRISASVATLLFYVYSVLNGVVFSVIFLAYTTSSIAQTFLITAGVFGAMTIYGYCTKSSLAKLGSFLYMALFGLIICIVANIFFQSSRLEWIISFAGVAIFIGLTAWDTQKIKQMIAMDGGMNTGKIATIGALSLYLDFVNLFLYLLRFFGSSRD